MISSPLFEQQQQPPITQPNTPPRQHSTAASTHTSPVGSVVFSSPKHGADKSTQTQTGAPTQTSSPSGPVAATDPSVFCNALCTMLLDRIKDTLQEAMKSYSSDTDREHKMKSIVNEAISNAGTDIDKKLSIVSVQSLMQHHPTVSMTRTEEPQQQHSVHVIPSPPATAVIPSTAELQSSPLLMSNPVSTVVSDYINKLSFIYGPSRPSMFNPYVKPVGRGEQEQPAADEKENQPTAMLTEQLIPTSSGPVSEKSSPQSTVINMEVESTIEQDINIIDDVEDEHRPSNTTSQLGHLSSEHHHHHHTTSPIVSSPAGPITPIRPLSMTLSSPCHLRMSPTGGTSGLALSPSTLQDKFNASALTPSGFVDSSVHFELQKILLNAAMAQNGGPGFSPATSSLLTATTAGKETEPRQDHIPVMIPSLSRGAPASNGFFDKREYRCEHCDATFSYGSKLRAHMICVHSIKSYQCRQCRKSFLDKDEYLQHLELHPQKKFQCDKCPSSFDKQHQLSLHYRSHTNEKPYRCQICQRQFAVNDALIRHMRIHTGERPYACNVCGKRFAQKSGLTYHSYLHTGNRPYKCTTCGQGFVHRQALKQHLMKNHLNEQVGRILNSANTTSAVFRPSPAIQQVGQPTPGIVAPGGLAWNKESLVTAEAMKRAFSWETKDPSPAFKLEGMAS